MGSISTLGQEQQPKVCQLEISEKGVMSCVGECPIYYYRDGDNCKEVKGECKLVGKTGGKRPGGWDCVCVYNIPGKKCELVVDKVSGIRSCRGECPSLFSSKKDCEDKKTPDAKFKCELYTYRKSETELIFECFCVKA